MTSNRIRNIWNNALPLGEAWIAFASTQAREQLKILPTGIEKMQNQLEKSTEILDFLLAASAGYSARDERTKFTNELQEELLDKLFNSELLAFGYRQKPSESRGPVQIDPNFFECPDTDWEGNTAEFNDKKYRTIRIANPKDLMAHQKPKTGRPTSGPVINAAINRLMKSNLEFCNLDRLIACEEIRKSIGQQSKRGNGLSDKNLEKYIIEHCGRRRIPN